MDTREIAAEYRLAHWTQILKERATSGLSIREYCKNAGIAECVFYYWQKKLREAASRELALRRDSLPEGSIAPKGWALCEAKETKAVATGVTVEIGQYRITVERGADSETQATVIRALTATC
jgi:transposase-like protein